MVSPISETSFYQKHPYYLKNSEIYYPESDGEPMAETDFHINLITYLRTALETFFADRDDVYVTGNIMFYYLEGAPDEVVSPDVMVCFGTTKGERRNYKVWEEDNIIPSVIFEISSPRTWRRDNIEKRQTYELLGVKEYYVFNLDSPKSLNGVKAYHLQNSRYEAVSIKDGWVTSETMSLDIVNIGTTLRLFNPKTDKFLLTVKELRHENAELKAELERLRKLLGQ